MQSYSLKEYSFIERIKQELTIEEAVLRYAGVELKRKGRRLWGICPFHYERTPSFMVDIVKQKARCFSCQWYGDAIDLVGMVAGLNVHELAASLGIDTGQTMLPDRRKTLSMQLKQQQQIEQLVKNLQEQIDDFYLNLCSVLRATYPITDTIRTEADLERPGLSTVFDVQTMIPFLLDELMSEQPERQYAALAAARRLIM